jgi:hypothetical protein
MPDTATLLDWLWATLFLALPLFAHPSFAVGMGGFVGGYTLGQATMAKDGLAVVGILRALLIGITTGVMVWMLQLLYISWRLAQ